MTAQHLCFDSYVEYTIRHSLPPYVGDGPMLLSGFTQKLHAIELLVGRATVLVVQDYFPWLLKLTHH